jgi:hypothetical protein
MEPKTGNRAIANRIIEWCGSDESFDYLPANCGWTSGGCAVLGLAVSELLTDAGTWGLFGIRTDRGDLGSVRLGTLRAPNILQHVVVKAPGTVFDGHNRYKGDMAGAAAAYARAEGIVISGWKPVFWEEIAAGGEIECHRDTVRDIGLALGRFLNGQSLQVPREQRRLAGRSYRVKES